MSIPDPELTDQEKELAAFFSRVMEETQSPLLIAEAFVAVYEKWEVKETNDLRLTQSWVSFTITTSTEKIDLAIWRNTGNVYKIVDGAVEDDPIIVITPPDMSGGSTG